MKKIPAISLRPYQRATIDSVYEWFHANAKGHPVVVLPTGGGKSIIVASLIQEALQSWPETRILMLTHVKELLEQNHEKMIELWPDAPVGIFSASMRQKVLTEPITFAGIQSIHKHPEKLGHCDLVIIDECHLLNNKQEGKYREFIAALERINPSLRVIGLTATPYRLGQGYLNEGDNALFTDIIQSTSIEQLVDDGFLAPLRSKHTRAAIDVSNVHKVAGEYKADELEQAAMKSSGGIALEVLDRTRDCKSVLVFCAGVDAAVEMSELLGGEFVHGGTSKTEREEKLRRFKNFETKFLTNANILTTGFNHPDLDCIVLARPTMSPGLYVQMAGRGMRIKSHVKECLVLDFAGCVAQHGPVTQVIPPSKKGGKPGDAPVKTCPGILPDGSECLELIHLSVMICPACGYVFQKKEQKQKLHDDCIMGFSPLEMIVTEWEWRVHVSKQSQKEMLKVKYYSSGLSDEAVTEYFPVTHDGYAGDKARGMLAIIANNANADSLPNNLPGIVNVINRSQPPGKIQYKRDGKFFRVTGRSWNV